MELRGALGASVLFGVWIWPLPALATPPFATHMLGHMLVVALAAPLLALAWNRAPRLPAIPASMLEGVAVWAWHAPALHHAARHDLLAYAVEQATFLATSFALWSAAIARDRAIPGVAALLFTSMHMTLLGALILLAPRSLYGHGDLLDQQLGGAIMLVCGGAAYLAGGLALVADLVRPVRA